MNAGDFDKKIVEKGFSNTLARYNVEKKTLEKKSSLIRNSLLSPRQSPQTPTQVLLTKEDQEKQFVNQKNVAEELKKTSSFVFKK